MQMQNLTEVVRSKDLLLKVEGHSVTMAMGDSDFIRSKKWAFGGHDWEVHLRPAGNNRSVAFKLVLISQPRGGNVKAKLSCRLVDPAGRLKPSKGKQKSICCISHKFLKFGDYSYLTVLAGREELEASGYLADDSYTVQCNITVLKEAPASKTSATPVDQDCHQDAAVASPDLQLHFGELLQKGTGADVTFLVSGEEFVAHKCILASRSPVFMAELFGGMKEEASRRVEVKDMEPAAFKALLRFIYTDTAPDLLDPNGKDATSMAQHLLAAADRYGIDRLKLLCEGRLADSLTVDTAVTTLALAEQHGFSKLKASCVEFIVGYLDAVLETEGYKHLEASCPSVVIDILKAARRPTK